MTLDPGHFHAALIQKSMYDQVNKVVDVYGPEGPDIIDHLKRIEGFNNREQHPTKWIENIHTGPDFLDRMLNERPGNVVVLSGNNGKKTDYILKAAKAGLNIFSDKPMVTGPEKLPLLIEAFKIAEANGVLLYDIMTERYEITTIMQKELAQIPTVFGELINGSPKNPAITKESVHHFFKHVAGNPIKRPPWFFDVEQQGDGIVDVSTHLVDLVQWECFSERIIDYKKDIKIVTAKRWPTLLSLDQFKKVTHLDSFPDYLKKDILGDKLNVYSNGEMIYKLFGVYAKVSVIWNFQAPEGAKDMHYSIMRGSKCNLTIRQGPDENYKPVLYIDSNDNHRIKKALESAVSSKLQAKFPGISLKELEKGKWILNIPSKYKLGHEAHFAQVTQKYLRFLVDGKLPAWEVPNMIAKYYTTTSALKMAESRKRVDTVYR